MEHHRNKVSTRVAFCGFALSIVGGPALLSPVLLSPVLLSPVLAQNLAQNDEPGGKNASADFFTTSDSNQDGALDSAEYATFVSLLADAGNTEAIDAIENKTIRSGFKALDTDKDGKLTRTELGG